MVPIQQRSVKGTDQSGNWTKRKQDPADDLQMSKREKLQHVTDAELSSIGSKTRSDSEIMMTETGSVDEESIPRKVEKLFSAKELEWCKGRGLFEALKAELSVDLCRLTECLLTAWLASGPRYQG